MGALPTLAGVAKLMACPGRTLFVCWLAVLLTGSRVDHRHIAAPNHTHGLGWGALPDPPESEPPPFAHCHFVLLGVELGAIPGTDHDSAPTGDGIRPAAGVLVPGDDLNRSFDSACMLVSLPILFASEYLPNPSVLSVNLLTPPRTDSPCPRVSRARTGVLRV